MSEKKLYFDEVFNLTKDKESVAQLYKEWAQQYDGEMADRGYCSPKLLTDAFLELGLSPNVKIVDVGAGTGIVSRILKPKGYYNMDALDGTQEMLDKAKEQKLYKNYYCGMLGKGLTITEIPSENYDVAMLVGVFVPNHMDAGVFPELLRITKKGGLILMTRGLQYGEEYPELGVAFDEEVESLLTTGRWKHHIPTKDVDNYLDGHPARIYIMERI